MLTCTCHASLCSLTKVVCSHFPVSFSSDDDDDDEVVGATVGGDDDDDAAVDGDEDGDDAAAALRRETMEIQKRSQQRTMLVSRI